MSEPETRCGFVSVLGLPNAGKSTLVNALAGGKVSIVSRKIQTTRSRVLGIAMRNSSQIILIDTPGIFEPKKTLEKAMVETAWNSIAESDIVLHIADAANKKTLDDNKRIADRLPPGKKSVLVLNKIDKIARPDLLALAEKLAAQASYEAVFMISALKKDGMEKLADWLAQHLPEGPYLFPEDQLSDMPARMLAAEITREKIFDLLHQELPYAIMVETENWEEFENGSVKIDQIVYVQRKNQKAIVLGKGGTQIKKIGETARRELEDILERRVHLKLFVKVEPDWPDKPEFLRLSGLNWPG